MPVIAFVLVWTSSNAATAAELMVCVAAFEDPEIVLKNKAVL